MRKHRAVCVQFGTVIRNAGQAGNQQGITTQLPGETGHGFVTFCEV